MSSSFVPYHSHLQEEHRFLMSGGRADQHDGEGEDEPVVSDEFISIFVFFAMFMFMLLILFCGWVIARWANAYYIDGINDETGTWQRGTHSDDDCGMKKDREFILSHLVISKVDPGADKKSVDDDDTILRLEEGNATEEIHQDECGTAIIALDIPLEDGVKDIDAGECALADDKTSECPTKHMSTSGHTSCDGDGCLPYSTGWRERLDDEECGTMEDRPEDAPDSLIRTSEIKEAPTPSKVTVENVEKRDSLMQGKGHNILCRRASVATTDIATDCGSCSGDGSQDDVEAAATVHPQTKTSDEGALHLHNCDNDDVQDSPSRHELDSTSERTCAICLGEYEEGDEVARSRDDDACQHEFHVDCIVMWLGNHDDCPCCRRPYFSEEVRRMTELLRALQTARF